MQQHLNEIVLTLTGQYTRKRIRSAPLRLDVSTPTKKLKQDKQGQNKKVESKKSKSPSKKSKSPRKNRQIRASNTSKKRQSKEQAEEDVEEEDHFIYLTKLPQEIFDRIIISDDSNEEIEDMDTFCLSCKKTFIKDDEVLRCKRCSRDLVHNMVECESELLNKFEDDESIAKVLAMCSTCPLKWRKGYICEYCRSHICGKCVIIINRE